MLDLVDEFRALLDGLERGGVDYAVCGGLAFAIHARPRATIDVDLLLPIEEVERAKQVAREQGYRIEAGPLQIRKDVIEIHRLSKPDPETGDLLSLDLLVVTPTLAPVWETRQRVGWEHGTVPVVSRAGLVTMKRLRASGQDLDDIRMLEVEDGTD
jgi:hypothetical protein